jgi:predicted ATP-dependent serine protease
MMDTVNEIENVKLTNKNVQEFASKFCKLQSLKHVLADINKKVERGLVDDFDFIEQKLKDALTYKEAEDSISVFHDIDGVLAEDYREPIPTGVDGIDSVMKGGLAKGELALVVAGTGVGKSTFLTKAANTGYMAGHNV